MLAQDLFPVDEAARRLGVNSARVRALLAAGQLNGEKVGGRWLVHGESVRQRERESHSRGRQLSPANAWAALFLASGQEAPWLGGSDRSRLLRLLDRDGLHELSQRSYRRAATQSFAAHPGILQHLSRDDDLVVAGISAARAYRLGLNSGQELDAYVRAARVPRLVSEFALAEPAAGPANVKLRAVPDSAWHFTERVAPVAAVAVDLAHEADARSARIGMQVLRQLDEQHRWQAFARRRGRPRGPAPVDG